MDTRPFYTLARQVLNENRSHFAHFRTLYRLDLIIFVYGFIRLFTIFLLTFPKYEHSTWIKWDPVADWAWRNPDWYDQGEPWIVIIFDVFNVYCQYKIVYLKPGNTWCWWYQVIVDNQDRYHECRLPLDKLKAIVRQNEMNIRAELVDSRFGAAIHFVPENFIRIYCRGRARVRVWRRLEDVDRDKLFRRNQLPLLPDMSDELRAKMLLNLMVLDRILQATLLTFRKSLGFIIAKILILKIDTIVALCIAVVIVLPVVILHRNFHWYFLVWTFVDFGLICYQLMRMLKVAFFMICFAVMALIVQGGHVQELNRLVVKLIRLLNQTTAVDEQRHSVQVGLQRTVLTRFLVDHTRICIVLIDANKQVFGPVMFCFMLTNVPINVYLISRFLLKPNFAFEFFITCIAFITQLLAINVTMTTLAANCKIMHSPIRFIPALQQVVRARESLQLKLRFLELYSRLSTGSPQYGISIGELHTITPMKIYEVFMPFG